MKNIKLIIEMSEEDFNYMNKVLKRYIRQEYDMDYVQRDHMQDRITVKRSNAPRDQGAHRYKYLGGDLKPQDVFSTFDKFTKKYKGKVIGFQSRGRELEGVIYDKDSHVGMVFAINYGAERDPSGKRVRRNKFKIVTIRREKNFKPRRGGDKYFVV